MSQNKYISFIHKVFRDGNYFKLSYIIRIASSISGVTFPCARQYVPDESVDCGIRTQMKYHGSLLGAVHRSNVTEYTVVPLTKERSSVDSRVADSKPLPLGGQSIPTKPP